MEVWRDSMLIIGGLSLAGCICYKYAFCTLFITEDTLEQPLEQQEREQLNIDMSPLVLNDQENTV
jgi:hypothetical protein